MNDINFKWDGEELRYILKKFMSQHVSPKPIDQVIDEFISSHTTKEEEVGWEIVEGGYSKESAHPWLTNDKAIESCEKIGCKIFSVRRKSDGVVFSVGDEVISKYFGNGMIRKIIEFFISPPRNEMNIKQKYGDTLLTDIEPLPKRTKLTTNGSLIREIEIINERIAYIEKKLNIEG